MLSAVIREGNMRLGQAVSDYIDQAEIVGETAAKLRHRLNCWKRHSTVVDAEKLTPEAFNKFREAARSAGLSARTIEETVNDIALISGVRELGRRLKRWKTSETRFVPSLELISTAYQNAELAVWPNSPLTRSAELRSVSSGVWLRAFIVFAYHTGLRLRDLRTITWLSITPDQIDWRSSKTGKRHLLPNCSVVERHLAPLRDAGSDRVFPISAGQERLLRRELSVLAGDVAAFGPQPLRRSSVTQWSLANATAGQLVQGMALGVMSRYVDSLATLADALPRRAWPAAMLTAEERDERQSRQNSIIDLAQRLPMDRLDDLLKVGRAFAS